MRSFIPAFLLFIFSYTCVGQQEVLKMEYEIPVTQQKQPSYVEYLNDSLKQEPLFYTKHMELQDGQIRIYNRYSILGQVTIPIALPSDKNQLIPVMSMVNFNTRENKITQTIENIHLHDIWKSGPLEYTSTQLKPLRQEMGSSQKDKHLAALKTMYPDAFATFPNKRDTVIKRSAAEKNETQYSLTTSKRILEKFESPVMTPVIKSVDTVYPVNTSTVFEKLHNHNAYIYNPKQYTWTSLHGEDLKGKDNKASKYTNLHFITSSEQGKILKDTKIDFEFTRHALLNRYVPNVKNPASGKLVYLFGRQSSLFGSSAGNDPDKTRYQIVVLNEDGSLDYMHAFNIAEGRSFIPLFVYMNEERLYVVSRSEQDLMMLTVNKTGVIIIQDAFSLFTGKPSTRINFNWEFYDYKVVNGQLYFWGEQRKMVQAASSSPQSGVKIPEIINYIDFSVVQIDLTQNLIVRQYGFERQEGDLTVKTNVEDIFVVNNKVVFYTSLTRRIKGKDEYENSNRLNFYSNNQYAASWTEHNKITRPVLYTIDPVSKGATSYKVSDSGFANLYPGKSYLKDNKNLYLIGFDDNRKQDELTYKIIVIGF